MSNAATSVNANSGIGTSLGGALGGAAAGAMAGSVVPILGNVLGAAAGAIIGGVFDLWNGSENRKAAAKAQAEAKEMAERQFAWGQTMDRFGMKMQTATFDRQKLESNAAMLNEKMKNNVALQNHVATLFGRNKR